MQSRGIRTMDPREAVKKYRATIPNANEAIYQPLYDYQALSASAVASQRFFQVPVGQGTSVTNGSGAKTLTDTNMDLAGQLPAGQGFLVQEIQVEIYPGVAINGTTASKFADDEYTVRKTARLEMTILSKKFLIQANLMSFPSSNRLEMNSSTTVSTDRYVYAAAAGRMFTIAELFLQANVNFNVELIDLPALPSSTAGKIGIKLNGILFRNSQ